jgi:glycerol kinase
MHRCDVSNASRTQLMNLRTRQWDGALTELFGVPEPVLPEIAPSSGIFGETVQLGALPADVPIASMIGDSHAALFGQSGFREGTLKATYGTGSSLMSRTRGPVASDRGLSSTIAWGIGEEVDYALEGNISVTGAALQWVSDLLGLDDPAVAAELADRVEGSDGVYVVPAFVGLGAPHWAERARGLVTGITRGTTAAHLARAVLESIAFQVRDVFDAMASEIGAGAEVLLADGGASRNDRLMQFQADVLGRPVLRNNDTEISALGAAQLAGLSVGHWKSLDEIAALPKSLDRFEPKMGRAERDALLAGWDTAVARCLFDPDRAS